MGKSTILNTYLSTNHDAVLKDIQLEVVQDMKGNQDYFEMFKFAVMGNRLETTKKVLELIWDTKVNNIQTNIFIQQMNKGYVEDNLRVYLDCFVKYAELGFTPYILEDYTLNIMQNNTTIKCKRKGYDFTFEVADYLVNDLVELAHEYKQGKIQMTDEGCVWDEELINGDLSKLDFIEIVFELLADVSFADRRFAI